MKSGATTTYEQPFWLYRQLVAGVDEVGRGAVAGPVVAAAVVLRTTSIPQGLADSKTLSAAQRHSLAQAIRLSALAVGVGVVDALDVDAINIQQATFLAMRQAVDALEVVPDHLLIDGPRFTPHSIPHTCIIRGDAASVSIAAASIVAKTYRDALMRGTYHTLFPTYGFDKHVGYGTPYHLSMIRQHGLCAIHRRTFLRSILTL